MPMHCELMWTSNINMLILSCYSKMSSLPAFKSFSGRKHSNCLYSAFGQGLQKTLYAKGQGLQATLYAFGQHYMPSSNSLCLRATLYTFGQGLRATIFLVIFYFCRGLILLSMKLKLTEIISFRDC